MSILNDQKYDYDKKINCNRGQKICTLGNKFLKYLDKYDGEITGINGNYQIKFNNSKEQKTIVLNKIYKSNWNAFHNNKKLDTFDYEGYLSIIVPSGIDKIRLIYRNNLIKLILISIILYLIFCFAYYFAIVKNTNKILKF